MTTRKGPSDAKSLASQGGRARADKLSASRRREIAKRRLWPGGGVISLWPNGTDS